jgi:hypothetical protein
MTPGTETSPPQAEATDRRWRAARLTGAALVAIAMLAFLVLSGRHGELQACSQQLQPNSSIPVRVCGPLAATDPPVVVGLVLVLLLILPDFAEVAVPGFVSLRRRVDEQGRRQEKLEEHVRLAVSQTATAHINQFLPTVADPKTFDELSRRVDRLEGNSEIDDEPSTLSSDADRRTSDSLTTVPQDAADGPARTQPVMTPGAARSMLATELISRAERLADAARRAQQLEDSLGGRANSSDEALRAWWGSFREELSYVQAARNSVAHAKPLEDDTLQSAVDLARRLDDALSQVIGSAGDSEAALVARVRAWLMGAGVQVHAAAIDSGLDLTGSEGGRAVLVEVRLVAGEVTRFRLTGWVDRFESAAAQFPQARCILVVSGSRVRRQALQYALASHVEIYFEAQLGEFLTAQEFLDRAGA